MNSPRSTRDGFGDALEEIGRINENIYVIDNDLSKSTKTIKFANTFPERHLNGGIAEQNTAGVAAGLSTIGKIPILSTYAVFGSMRICEQVRTSICYPNLNVKLACTHGGISNGYDGPTHHAIEDMGIYRSIPGMTIIVPSDYYSSKILLNEAVDYVGPVYLRFSRDEVPNVYSEGYKLKIGKASVLKKGRDICLISTGDILKESIKASKMLEKRGVAVEVVDMHTVKPLDNEYVNDAINRIGKIITVEEHNVYNGLGSAIADIIAHSGKGILRNVGLKDCFTESGDYNDLIKKYKLDADYIVKMAEELI